MRSKLIILALAGLLAGAAGPPPCHAQSPGPSARRWIEAVDQRDGTARLISGWIGPDGKPHFDPREYPDFVARPDAAPAPKPDPGPLPDPTQRPDRSMPFPAKGVIQERIPKPVAGQAWYGGNAARVIEDSATRAKPPDVHLTVIGDRAEQDRVRSRLEADPKFKAMQAELGDRLAVQFYPPDDPMVARVGLVDGGKPDVVIQDATGKERFRKHSDPGPASIVREIRKADPDYRPGRDDAPGGPFPISGPAMLVIGVVAGLVGLHLYQRNQAARP